MLALVVSVTPWLKNSCLNWIVFISALDRFSPLGFLDWERGALDPEKAPGTFYLWFSSFL